MLSIISAAVLSEEDEKQVMLVVLASSIAPALPPCAVHYDGKEVVFGGCW